MAKGIAHREWTISRSEFTNDFGRVDEAAFNSAVQFELSMAEHIMKRLGVAIVAAPVSRQGSNGVWYREAYVFRTATVPSAREAEHEDADVGEDEIEIPTLAEVE